MAMYGTDDLDAEKALLIVYDLWEQEGEFDKESNLYLPGNFFHFLDLSMLAMFRRLYRRPYVHPDILSSLENRNVERTSRILGRLHPYNSKESFLGVNNAFRKELVAAEIAKSLSFLDGGEIDHLFSVAGKDGYPLAYRIYNEKRYGNIDSKLKNFIYTPHLNRYDIMAAFGGGSRIAEDFLRDLSKHFTRDKIQKTINECCFDPYDLSVLEELEYDFYPEERIYSFMRSSTEK